MKRLLRVLSVINPFGGFADTWPRVEGQAFDVFGVGERALRRATRRS